MAEGGQMGEICQDHRTKQDRTSSYSNAITTEPEKQSGELLYKQMTEHSSFNTNTGLLLI